MGLLGVEQSLKKNHDERSNNLIRHDTVASLKKPNPNENEILRVMDICILIGQTKFDQFWNGSFLKCSRFGLVSFKNEFYSFGDRRTRSAGL